MKIIFSILILVFSLVRINVDCYSDQGISKNEQAVNNLLDQAAKALKKKYKMQPIGTNVAMPRGNVKLLGLDFQVHHPLSKEEIRRILINCAQEFLMRINSDEELRPYLKRYPFELDDISIVIFIKDKNRERIYDPLISVADISHDKLTYYTVPEENPLKYNSIVSESYEEALIALQSN